MYTVNIRRIKTILEKVRNHNQFEKWKYYFLSGAADGFIYPFSSFRDEKQGARIAINVNVTPLIATAMLIPRYHEERKSSIKIN